MQEIDSTLPSATTRPKAPASPIPPPPRRRSHLRHFALFYLALFLILLIALIPPLISVNRFQRRITMSISQSLGRPVHLDTVTLSLLPLPGFTLQNLVVSEDPAFGNEPIIRAMSVHATLRISSLWRRQVEFSTISFTDTTSVNLVHLPDGRWNLESILIQAARINAAPTAQRTAGPAPRFPYIEANGARVNLKVGQEKLPISLTDADFALWLPDPSAWHLRIEAHPARTDTDVSDTGTLRVEGTLGRAATLSQVPINLDAEWSAAPLGEVTHLILGHDAGIRGNMVLTAHAQGTVGNSALNTRLRLNALRRADFIPREPLNIEINCHGVATNTFHTYTGAQCHWPSDNPSLILEAAFPDVRDLDSTAARLTIQDLPIPTTLDWLHAASSRIPQDISATGSLIGTVEANPGLVTRWSRWSSLIAASFHLTSLTLQSTQAGLTPLELGDIILQDVPPTPAPTPSTHHRRNPPPADRPPNGLYLTPTTIPLGGKDPATLEGHIDSTGYTLHLTGMAVLSRLNALAKALPPFGDNLADALPTNRAPGPVRLDLTATRSWGHPQQWQDTSPRPTPTHRKSR
jgi:AsmA family